MDQTKEGIWPDKLKFLKILNKDKDSSLWVTINSNNKMRGRKLLQGVHRFAGYIWKGVYPSHITNSPAYDMMNTSLKTPVLFQW